MRRGRKEHAARILMLPLLDVVFILLVVFIFSMMTMVRSYVVPVDLPRMGTGEVTDLVTVLVISVEEDGTVAVGGTDVPPEDVEREVRARREREPDLSILVNADREARHGDVSSVLDAIRAAGGERILLVARPEDE